MIYKHPKFEWDDGLSAWKYSGNLSELKSYVWSNSDILYYDYDNDEDIWTLTGHSGTGDIQEHFWDYEELGHFIDKILK
jgi:hypothetical protein